jgi:murein DD-endopeptidase MepM/ murein hydrolase activator NlpD
MSRYKKAAAAMLFLFIIWVSFFLLLFLLKWVHANKLLSYKGEIDIFIERNDQGSEIYTLLSGEKDYYKNMVVLGASAAKNMPAEVDRQLKNSLDDIAAAKKATEYYLNVWDGPTLLKSFGNKPATSAPATTMLNQPLGTQLGNYVTLSWPVKNYNTIGDGYGWRLLKGRMDAHGGIDFAVPDGTDVYSAYPSGKVVRTGKDCEPSPDKCAAVSSCSASQDEYCCCNGGLGNFIVIKHEINGEAFYTHYDHLKEVYVDVNDELGKDIRPNEAIGKSGTTGFSTGYHLHFELSKSEQKSDESSINPCPYFPQPVPDDCEQESQKTTAYREEGVYAEIPLPNGEKGRIELVL